MKETYLKGFKEYMINQDRTISTIKNYTFQIKRFINYYESSYEEIFNAADVQSLDLIEYRKFMISKNYKASYINNSLAALKTYYSYLYIFNIILENPSKNTKKIKSYDTYTKYSISISEIKKLRREIYKTGSDRDQLMFDIFIFCGLRKSELINIKLENIVINERSGHIEVISKGLKMRQVPLISELRKNIKFYIESKEQYSEYLFFNKSTSCKLHVSTINKILEKYTARVKLDKKVTVHQLRHFFAQNFLRNNPDVNSLQELQVILGHSSLLSTEKYLAVNLERLNNSMENIEL